MPRPKGSKNKKNRVSSPEQLAAAQAATREEIAKLSEIVIQSAEQLKAKKAELKAAQKRLKNLNEQEETMRQREEIAQRRVEAETLVAAYIESGKSLDEALEALR